jgi:WhiB family redox-sensing transcriptional regulator
MSVSQHSPHFGAGSFTRPDWRWTDDAECHGEDLILFFGPDGERTRERVIRERKAKKVCARCPVEQACLDYAVSRPEKHGTWGGMSEEERASERRRRMRKANAA